MLLWFVDEEVAMRVIDGELIDETSVEVDPTNLCSDVADENINLEAIQNFFSNDAWVAVLSTGTNIIITHINIPLL